MGYEIIEAAGFVGFAEERAMLDLLIANWWTFLLRGVAALLFGVIALIWPALGLLYLVILFGVYAFVDGLLAMTAAFAGVGGQRWWALLIEGIIGIVIAVLVVALPAVSALALVYLIAFWAILTGILEIMGGIQLRDFIKNEWLFILAGILSVAFGILVIRNPVAGAVAEIWIIGAYAIVFGVVNVGVALKLRKMKTVFTAA
jgi:uncharacterized membrane protein HdeD (DUF308 family)